MHGGSPSFGSSRSTERTPRPPQSQRESTSEANVGWMVDNSKPLYGTLPLEMGNLRGVDAQSLQSGSSAQSTYMTVGHGSVYQSSIGDLLSRVCGSQTSPEPVDELLAIYFAWQEPQHMPVDEGLFRRRCSQSPIS